MSKKSHLANRTKSKRSRVTRVRAAKSNSQIVREALRKKAKPIGFVGGRAEMYDLLNEIADYLLVREDLVSSYPWPDVCCGKPVGKA
jgi:hypothetical protein